MKISQKIRRRQHDEHTNKQKYEENAKKLRTEYEGNRNFEENKNRNLKQNTKAIVKSQENTKKIL